MKRSARLISRNTWLQKRQDPDFEERPLFGGSLITGLRNTLNRHWYKEALSIWPLCNLGNATAFGPLMTCTWTVQ